MCRKKGASIAVDSIVVGDLIAGHIHAVSTTLTTAGSNNNCA